MNFQHAKARLTIGSLDQPALTLSAQYNPTELELTKEIPYGEKNGLGVTPSADAQRSAAANQGQSQLEFTGSKGRTIKIDLFFDGYEDGRSIEPMIDLLDRLSSARDATSLDERLRRPHHLVVAWGKSGRTIPPFRCVITALSVKYTVFSDTGVPLRAMATVTLSEGGIVDLAAANDRSYRSGSSVMDSARALAAFDIGAPIAAIAARISSGVRIDVSGRGTLERAVRRAVG